MLARAYDGLLLPIQHHFTTAQIDAAYPFYFHLVWSAFFVSLIAYDRVVARRVHPVSLFGFLWFVIVSVIAVLA